MAASFIPPSLQKLWNAWNIRGFMLLSLFLQLLLASIAQQRRKSNNRFVILVIWSAYFTTDWAATFTFGLISNAQRCESVNPPEVDENHLAFWAAFLLIHLGGPDTITAFSLEDNAMWTRHLVGLVAQLFTFLYIFLKTLPDNSLAVPTILIAIAGTLKYGERTKALYRASKENVKKSMLKQSSTSHLRIDFDSEETASYFFQIFKGLVFNITPIKEEVDQSQMFLQLCSLTVAFDTMTKELDLLYELFYTKILALKSSWGVLIRTIAFYNVVAALILYSRAKTESSHEVDIWITFFLLGGVLALETFSGILLLASDWSNKERLSRGMFYVARGVFFIIPSMVVILAMLLFEYICGEGRIIKKSWHKKLGAFSLISHCVGQYQQPNNKLMEYVCTFSCKTNRHEYRNTFCEDIPKFIFKEVLEWLRNHVFSFDNRTSRIPNARGDMTIEAFGCNISELMLYVGDFEYHESLLVWHIATDICYYTDPHANETMTFPQIKFAKVLSDYMNYLLTRKPDMLPTAEGISLMRYRNTCADVLHLCRAHRAETVKAFCLKMMDGGMRTERPSMDRDRYRDRSASVLSEASKLAALLERGDRKWEVISGVWVEMLTYAAAHCRMDVHPRPLSEGWEILSVIWLLLAHFGIGANFPKYFSLYY